MAFIRKHRASRRGLDRGHRVPEQRQTLRAQHEGIVVHDFDGSEIFRTGTYGAEIGDEDTRGMVFSDSDGNSTAELNATQISMGNPIIGTVQSDNIVQSSDTTIQRFIDPTNGSDDNDGLMPVTLADTLNRTTASGWGDASDGYHSWTIDNGTAADFSTTTTPDARMSLNVSDEKVIRLNGGGALCEEVYFETQANKAPSSGTMDFGVIFRAHTKGANFTGDGNGLFGRLSWTSTAAPPKVEVFSVKGGVYTSRSSQNLAANWAVNTPYGVRVQCYDIAGQTTIRARAWPLSGSEPNSWTAGTGVATWSGSDQTGYSDRTGQLGFRSATGGIANNPIVVRMNAFSYHILDIDLLAADDTSTVASDYYYAPTSTGPYASVTRALRDIPQYNQGYCILSVSIGQKGSPGDGVTGVIQEAPTIQGIQGGGKLVVTGCNPYWLGGLVVVGCNHDIIISGITFSDPGNNRDGATLNVNVSRYVEVYQCIFEGNTSNAGENIIFQQGSAGAVQNSQLHGAATQCLLVNTVSMVFASGNTGSSVGGTSYKCQGSLLIMLSATAPTGSLATSSSGMIMQNGGAGNYTVTASAPTTGGGTAPATSTKVTKTWNASKSGTYGMAYGTWAAGDVTQGSYGGSQNHKGLWVYPSGLQSTISAKTIDSAYITLRRDNNGGSSGAQNIYVCTFNQSSVSSGDPGATQSGPTLLGSLAWGQTKTFKLPAAVANDLKTAGHNIGIFQSDGSPYVTLLGVGHYSGSGKLKITYH